MVGRKAFRARLGAVVRSPRWSLGSLSAADLTLRADPVAAAVVDVLPAALSLTAGSLSVALGGLLTWLVFAVGYYHAADLIYRPAVGFPSGDPWFRATVAGSGVVVGWTIIRAGVGAAAVLGPLATGVLLAVLVRRHGWRLTAPDGEGVAFADTFFPRDDYPTERQANYEAGGARRAISTVFTFLLVACLVGVPLLLLAFATLVLLSAYPLPEVVLLAWAVVGLLARVVRGDMEGGPLGGDTESGPPDVPSPAELETGLYAATGRALRNEKGLVLTIISLFGAAAGALLLSASVLRLFSLGPTGEAHQLRAALALLGLALTAATGAYLLLFWGVELARLPAFVDRWEGVEDPATPPVGRVPGAALPVVPAIPLFVATALAIGRDAPLPVVRTLLIGWVVTGLALVAVVVWWGIGSPRRSVAGEDHYIAVGVLALLAAVSSLWYRDGLLTALGGGPLPDPRGLLVVPMAVLILAMIYGNDISRLSRTAGGAWRYADAVFLGAVGAVTVLTARLGTPAWQGRVELAGLLICGLGVVTAFLVAADSLLPGGPDGSDGRLEDN